MPQQYAPRVFGGPAPYTPVAPEAQPVGSPTIIVGSEARFCLAGSLSVQSKIGKRSNASCTVRTTTAVHFEQDQRIQIFDKDNTLIFNGYLDSPKEQKRGFKKNLVHTLTAVDG